MGEKMSIEFIITMQWERLLEGSAEECACFGMLCIKNKDISLSEGIDGFVNSSRLGPLVSGYPLAEWLAWNWWRLTVEPRQEHATSDWAFAHHLSTVGDGYLWPNITIFSDRARTAIIAKPTRSKGFTAFRFTADHILVLPSRSFEAAVDFFMGQIQGKLRESDIHETNLDRIWEEVLAERQSPAIAARRRIEALLGVDPDEGDTEQIEQLLGDASRLGAEAVQELALTQVSGQRLPTADELESVAKKQGGEIKYENQVRLDALDLPPCEQMPAWQRGYQVADALRKQQRLGHKPLTDRQLAELCGVSDGLLKVKQKTRKTGFSFGFCLENNAARIMLRSPRKSNRRFDLARLLGDQLAFGLDEPLLPATEAKSYRQKLQRAFAAELLCPFEALEEKLNGNYSDEACENAADYFKVSERTVRTLLVNHKRLDRDFLEDEAA
jgi:Zn-dependent peptidase ImmA (M78 family)